jgi:hypothetical protein
MPTTEARKTLRRRQGFTSHLAAAGVPGANIAAAAPRYATQDARRTAKAEGFKKAVRG